MSESINYSKRSFVLGALSLGGTGIAVATCERSTIASIGVQALSVISTEFKKIIENIPSGLTSNAIYDWSKSAYDRLEFSFIGKANAETSDSKDYNSVIQMAKKRGIDIGVAAKMADAAGSQLALDFMNSGSSLLIQKNQTSRRMPINIFEISVSNNTNLSISGQLYFRIVDQETGLKEGTDIPLNSFLLPPNQSYTKPYPIHFDFKTSGPKEIQVVDYPEGVQVNVLKKNILVLPYSARG